MGKRCVAEFPSKLKPLFEPHRYKILYGGRGGAKSWGIARALLTIGMNRQLRILCAREIMRTIKDSVHQLLKDQIKGLGYASFYQIRDTAITGLNGTQFIFTGLREMDAAKIKSFEGIDICWVEEGHSVTKKSWDTLIPTIRKEKSEIWVSFNPEMDTDNTYTRFVLNTVPDSWVIKLSWTDNPWFPDVLEVERAHLEKTNKEEHDHIWGGVPRTVVAGAIYAKEVTKLIEERRLRPTPYDPRLLVHSIWDLGFNDQTSIIFAQRLQSEVRIIHYMECSFMTYADWVREISKLPYAWGTDWLPWDGEITRQDTGKSAVGILKGLGRRVVKAVPKRDVEEGIRDVRMMMPRVFIDDREEKMDGAITVGCGRLMTCLRRYRRNIPTTTDEPSTPAHDQYSHGCDALRGMATIVDQMKNENEAKPLKYETWGQAVKGAM